MHLENLLFCLVIIGAFAFFFGQRRSLALAGGSIQKLRSLPAHYGAYAVLWTVLPVLVLIILWISFAPGVVESILVSELPANITALQADELNLFINDIKNCANDDSFAIEADPEKRAYADRYTELLASSSLGLWVLSGALALGGIGLAWQRIRPRLFARESIERVLVIGLMASSLVAIFTTVGIVLSVLFESIRFFGAVPFSDFMFGTEWSPQTAIRADQVGSSGAFGAVPLFAGTLLISAIAMTVAVPVGLMASIYLAEYADRRVRAVLKPMLEILAGIPTVVYGFFAALTVAPLIRDFGGAMGLTVASESALAAGLVMGIMIIPFVSSLSEDVISAVPQAMREGSYALGATHSETIRKVIIPAALPGIVGGVLLAVSRAIGETMIVVMAAGLAANLTMNPLEAVTTVTVQIVTLLVGDQEFDSPKTLAAFALGLMLFVMTLLLNLLALYVVRKYREQYD